MERKRIVWVDDEIETSILEPYVEEFIDNGIDIIKVKNVDGLMGVLKKEAQDSLSAILVDIIMPPGHLNYSETKGGLRTGIVVLNEILKENALRNIPKVVVSNVDDANVDEFCQKHEILYIKKYEYFANTFVERIIEEIIKYRGK